jgi:hypothetical protein
VLQDEAEAVRAMRHIDRRYGLESSPLEQRRDVLGVVFPTQEVEAVYVVDLSPQSRIDETRLEDLGLLGERNVILPRRDDVDRTGWWFKLEK